MFFQQFTGINAVLYYAPSIFEALGTSSNTTSLLATGVVGVAMFLATIPAVLYIDKLGRKPVMLAGSVGMAFCHFTIAIIFAQEPVPMGYAQNSRMGSRRHGLVLRRQFRLQLGSMVSYIFIPMTKQLT